jgi:hypothetical protein
MQLSRKSVHDTLDQRPDGRHSLSSSSPPRSDTYHYAWFPSSTHGGPGVPVNAAHDLLTPEPAQTPHAITAPAFSDCNDARFTHAHGPSLDEGSSSLQLIHAQTAFGSLPDTGLHGDTQPIPVFDPSQLPSVSSIETSRVWTTCLSCLKERRSDGSKMAEMAPAMLVCHGISTIGISTIGISTIGISTIGISTIGISTIGITLQQWQLSRNGTSPEMAPLQKWRLSKNGASPEMASNLSPLSKILNQSRS